MKGQFMIISAVVAALITISLSSTISQVQSQTYTPIKLPEHINLVREEAERITADGVITEEEKRNFRKMTNYIENYETSVKFNESVDCVQVTLQNPRKTAELPCIN